MSDNLPHQRHSPTSIAAADAAKPTAETQRRRVLEWLTVASSSSVLCGATDEEMQEGMTLAPNTQRPRRVELVRMGLVKDSGRTRPTRSGRQAVVWIAT
jgi:hypothetical protein